MAPLIPFTAADHSHGSTHEDIRRHNLSVLLRTVHRDGPTSRSRLAQLMSLNKSTIGALTKELLDLGLVEERVPNSNAQAGRPSRVVAPNKRVVAIAVNPEVGAVAIGIVTLGGEVIRRVRYSLPPTRSAEHAVELSGAFIDGMRSELDRDYLVAGIGVAVPGMVHGPDGSVTFAPHVSWARPIAGRLHEITGYPVLADNDARLGSLAERQFGVGRGIDDLIYLHGGANGISGGIIAGGAAVSGFSGYAGAFGHVRTNQGDGTDSAGMSGTLEAEVTRSALLEVLDLHEAGPDELESALLGSTDPRVRRVVEVQLDRLAVALSNAVNILNTRLIVLGGFLASLFAAAPEHLHNALAAKSLQGAFRGVEIKASALGFDMLLIGAAELVFDRILDDPAATRRIAQPEVAEVEQLAAW
ncbi:ROK family transcriptional regulator [Herbiconiux sp. L3-i23]|uniref:ROK family transcriptional regulator n=1 Tax=Herbiconiux sp. L3-i23 TaxID=2905871 RepID=UPI002046D356|nr:ROK family transcriptional regulator [Herbiconiux sp. L3-i23]BDI23478.1 sugar kinase [Herbiconiux sp. L3-i23]